MGLTKGRARRKSGCRGIFKIGGGGDNSEGLRREKVKKEQRLQQRVSKESTKRK